MSRISESESEVAIDIQLSACGWQLDPRKPDRDVYKQRARTKDQQDMLKPNIPDYVLYAHKDSDKPTLVIEAKKPGKSMADALAQGIERYAKKIDAPLVIASDGWRVKTWHIGCNAPLFLDGREVDELFSPEMARHFAESNNFGSFSQEAALGQDELIKKFRKANDILKGEGFSAGIERFSEFANLMFVKLQIEGGKKEIAGFSWNDLCAKQGDSLLKAVKGVFEELRGEHSGLFKQTQIQKPTSMESLIEILASFRLSLVKDDIKGIAFEHFIHSYTRGTKNDLGQYFTPRHIVKMMVHFLKPQIGEVVYDPFCGTGGMLIECFRYINQHTESDEHKQALKERTLFGRDNSSVARIAMMNMIMFGDGHTNIQQGDSYASIGEARNKYDIVITNIPFSQKTDFCEGYPVMPTGEKTGDSIGVQHCLESLKRRDTSRAAIIVPIGFLYKSELRQEREHILQNWTLEKVIELTPKCFQPYTEQQTAVLLISRQARREVYDYYQVKNDGYSQDGYRVPLHGENDIDATMDGSGKKECPIDASNPQFKTLDLFVRRGQVRLSEVAEVIPGASNISPKTKIIDVQNGTHPIMMVADLAKRHVDYCLAESTYKLTDSAVAVKKPHLFRENSILIPTTGKASLKNHRALLGIDAYATSTLTGVVAKGNIHPYCLFYFFLGFDAESITLDLGYPGISPSILQKIPLPNYPDKKQEEIISRVEEAVELCKKLKTAHAELSAFH